MRARATRMCVLTGVVPDPTGRHNRLLQAATQLAAEKRRRTSLVAGPVLQAAGRGALSTAWASYRAVQEHSSSRVQAVREAEQISQFPT